MGILGALFAPKPGPQDFNCARVHRGEYIADTNQYARLVAVDFQILHGDAVVKHGRPIQVYEPDADRFAKLQTFFIFPQSRYVRIMLKKGSGSRRINLFREDDRRKSRMFKQRL